MTWGFLPGPLTYFFHPVLKAFSRWCRVKVFMDPQTVQTFGITCWWLRGLFLNGLLCFQDVGWPLYKYITENKTLYDGSTSSTAERAKRHKEPLSNSSIRVEVIGRRNWKLSITVKSRVCWSFKPSEPGETSPGAPAKYNRVKVWCFLSE